MSRGLYPYSIHIVGGETQMAEKNNATCSICGKPYYICMSCKDSIQLHPWKSFTDTAEHYKVFQVVRGFSTNVYTKGEAKAKLKNINLDDLESFRPHIKQIIKDILKEEKPVKKTDCVITGEMVVEKPVYSRKRNYKVEAE